MPLHPLLVELITDRLAIRPLSRSGGRRRDDGHPFDRRTIHRYVDNVAKRAGVGHVHPHQFRHTLATQAINRGMSLEAIAALLGHRSMRMTLTYARISDRTVADEYFRVTGAVEAIYRRRAAPADIAGQNTAPHCRPSSTPRQRSLNRPVALDCIYETICERCGFFETGPQFVPSSKPTRSRRQHDQHERAQLFTSLLDNLDKAP